jgi:hypothetical protein
MNALKSSKNDNVMKTLELLVMNFTKKSLPFNIQICMWNALGFSITNIIQGHANSVNEIVGVDVDRHRLLIDICNR